MCPVTSPVHDIHQSDDSQQRHSGTATTLAEYSLGDVHNAGKGEGNQTPATSCSKRQTATRTMSGQDTQ